REAISKRELNFPFVQKTRTAGYDGRGVAIIKDREDLREKLLDAPSMLEPLVDIKKEIAVIVAQNESGEIKAFPPVEMEFNPDANLVEWVVCPAQIDEETSAKATQIAIDTIKALDICGLLAVELFLTNDDEILINEVAPRPHNSGHHTIDCAFTSQYQQHLRAILNWPLGATASHTPAIMVNLLGEDGYKGQAIYENVEKCLAIDGVKMHLYGKEMTKPFRKMGHATILDADLAKAREKARFVKDHLKIKA
ncbi:MAG: ATP-grasp domain-containing protein, partial [Bacteroidota bacterium]